MGSSTIHLIAKASQHCWGGTWNQGLSTLCAACSWAGNNMGWPALLGGSVVSGIGAGARAKVDGGACGGSAVPGFDSNSNSDPDSESHTPMQYSQPVPGPGAAPESNPIDPVYQALVKHLKGD